MRHRLNGGPGKEGKAGQDNEPAPEDQNSHAGNIRSSQPQIKVPSSAETP
jgi:hypothetical protein